MNHSPTHRAHIHTHCAESAEQHQSWVLKHEINTRSGRVPWCSFKLPLLPLQERQPRSGFLSVLHAVHVCRVTHSTGPQAQECFVHPLLCLPFWLHVSSSIEETVTWSNTSCLKLRAKRHLAPGLPLAATKLPLCLAGLSPLPGI